MICLRYWSSCGVIAAAIFMVGCLSGKEDLYNETKIIMGTVVQITVAHHSEEQARAGIRAAMSELQRVDDLLSVSKPGSLVTKINREGSSGKIPVGAEVFSLLRDTVAMSSASDGAFDATIWPVAELWDFDKGGMVPKPTLIASKLPLVGYQNILFDDSAMSVGFARQGMGLDLGAIAKGWAVDRAMEKLKSLGIRNAIIDAGGDLRIIGARPGKDFWKIGVQHPREPGALLTTFSLRDTAIVTSGDYERFFIAEGIRYHHILEPATGQPARGCRSVTVVAATAEEADACATAAFVLGPQKGLAFLRARPGLQGLIVDDRGALHWTDEAFERMAGR